MTSRRIVNTCFLPVFFTLASLLANAARAQAPLTLEQALSVADAPKSDLYLTVAADHVELPKEASAPESDDSVGQIATAFGRMVSGFGNVDAIAPPTIMVLNSPPETPNLYDGMEPKQIVKLLAATFTADQWKDFLSEKGVGYTDLADANQRAIFEALFPDGKLTAQHTGGDDVTREVKGDDLRQTHLRLAYHSMMALTEADHSGQAFAANYEPPTSLQLYYMKNSPSADADREYGAKVRETVPNVLKPSDLSDDDAAYQAKVPVQGWNTVDDVVRAAAAATGREIYADPRYAAKKVMALGPAQSVRALDLLRALALCVGGTYRKVGAALVLTDDLTGFGTKRALWVRFEKKAAAMLSGGENMFLQAGPVPGGYTLLDIPWTSDPYALTKEQQDAAWKKWRETPMQSSSPMIQWSVPFSQLSPAQQDAARHIQELDAKDNLKTTLDGDVMVQSEPMVQITTPSLDAPVLLFQSYDSLLPYPSLTAEEQKANDKKIAVMFPGSATVDAKDAAGLPPLRTSLQAFMRRAVRVAPQSKDEVSAEIAHMTALGLNEMWLVIEPGVDDKDDATTIDLLRAAVAAAKPAHIAVYPDIRLLAWRDAPDAILDRTLTGLTQKQENAKLQYPFSNVHDVVTPFEPETRRRLAALGGKASRVPSVAGMVWEDFAPNGYERHDSNSAEISDRLPLGCAIPGRLAGLRKLHADPIDLYTNHYTDCRANVHIPGFDDDRGRESALYDDWAKVRSQTGQALLQSLPQCLPAPFTVATSRRLPLIIPPANAVFSSIYGSWDDLSAPAPAVNYVSPIGPDGKPIPFSRSIEHMASQLVYQSLVIYQPTDIKPDALIQNVTATLVQDAKDGDRNVVLDETTWPHLLEKLAE